MKVIHLDAPRATTDPALVFRPDFSVSYLQGDSERIKALLRRVPRPTTMRAGSIAFFRGEEASSAICESLMVGWETYLLPGLVRDKDYCILWGLCEKEGSPAELRFLLPMIELGESDNALPVARQAFEKADLWALVRNRSLGLMEAKQAPRGGARPPLSFPERMPLVRAVQEHIEDAVRFGELQSRDDILEDLERQGFEKCFIDDQGLAVRYCGADEDIRTRLRGRRIELVGPIFSSAFAAPKDARMVTSLDQQKEALEERSMELLGGLKISLEQHGKSVFAEKERVLTEDIEGSIEKIRVLFSKEFDGLRELEGKRKALQEQIASLEHRTDEISKPFKRYVIGAASAAGLCCAVFLWFAAWSQGAIDRQSIWTDTKVQELEGAAQDWIAIQRMRQDLEQLEGRLSSLGQRVQYQLDDLEEMN